jgi:hypothetical protein
MLCQRADACQNIPTANIAEYQIGRAETGLVWNWDSSFSKRWPCGRKGVIIQETPKMPASAITALQTTDKVYRRRVFNRMGMAVFAITDAHFQTTVFAKTTSTI